MGYNLCKCENLCINKKEENLSSINLSTKYKYNIKSRNKLINTLSSFSSTENINSIYKKNCAQKIMKTYLKYKNNKMKYLYNEFKNNEFTDNTNEEEEKVEEENNKNNSKKSIETHDNFDQFSINHPFYIDKIKKSKTIYRNINIPKINNGKSLENLNHNIPFPDLNNNERKTLIKNKTNK